MHIRCSNGTTCEFLHRSHRRFSFSLGSSRLSLTHVLLCPQPHILMAIMQWFASNLFSPDKWKNRKRSYVKSRDPNMYCRSIGTYSTCEGCDICVCATYNGHQSWRLRRGATTHRHMQRCSALQDAAFTAIVNGTVHQSTSRILGSYVGSM